VVILAGEVTPPALRAIDRSANVALLRAGSDDLAGAADALGRAARITAPYVLVAADPLAALRSRSGPVRSSPPGGRARSSCPITTWC
jgi:hypothetical protein